MEKSKDVDVYFDVYVYVDVYLTLTLTLTKNGEGKGGKHLEKENVWSMEEKKNRVGKGGIIWRWKINGDADQPTDQP